MSERDELLALVHAELDGELTPAEEERLDAALRRDPELAREAEALRRLRDLFRAVPQVQAPAGFRDDVVRAAAATGGRGRLVRLAPWIAACAAAAAVLLAVGPRFVRPGRAPELADAPPKVTYSADERGAPSGAPMRVEAGRPAAPGRSRDLGEADDAAGAGAFPADARFGEAPPLEESAPPAAESEEKSAAPVADAEAAREPSDPAPEKELAPATDPVAAAAQPAADAAPARAVRYVVFADEAAARRFVAALRTERRRAPGRGAAPADGAGADSGDSGGKARTKDASRPAPSPPATPTSGAPAGGGAGGGGGGGGGGDGAGALAAEAPAPRVFARVVLDEGGLADALLAAGRLGASPDDARSRALGERAVEALDRGRRAASSGDAPAGSGPTTPGGTPPDEGSKNGDDAARRPAERAESAAEDDATGATFGGVRDAAEDAADSDGAAGAQVEIVVVLLAPAAPGAR